MRKIITIVQFLLFMCLANTTNAQWQKLGTPNIPDRMINTMKYFNGKIYTAGSFDANGTTYISIFDIATQTWSDMTIPGMSYKIISSMAFSNSGEIYVSALDPLNINNHYCDGIYKYDPSTSIWTKLPTCNIPNHILLNFCSMEVDDQGNLYCSSLIPITDPNSYGVCKYNSVTGWSQVGNIYVTGVMMLYDDKPDDPFSYREIGFTLKNNKLYLQGLGGIASTTLTGFSAPSYIDVFKCDLSDPLLNWQPLTSSNGQAALTGNGASIYVDNSDNVYVAGAMLSQSYPNFGYEGTIIKWDGSGTNGWLPLTNSQTRIDCGWVYDIKGDVSGNIYTLTPNSLSGLGYKSSNTGLPKWDIITQTWNELIDNNCNIQNSRFYMENDNLLLIDPSGNIYKTTKYYVHTYNTYPATSVQNYDMQYVEIFKHTIPPTLTITSNIPTNLCINVPATFTATLANTSGTTTYQWYLNSTPISGATSSTYTTSFSSNAAISCIVQTNNSCGDAVTINSNTLNINLLTSLPSIVGCSDFFVGKSATYTNSLAGGSWSVNSGSTNATINTTTGIANSVSAGSNTVFYSYTQNGCNLVTTKNINMVAVPTISIATPFTAICSGSATLNFTATASNNSPATTTYQWLKNNSNIAGATSTTCTTTVANNNAIICNLNSTLCNDVYSINSNTVNISQISSLQPISATTNLLCAPQKMSDNRFNQFTINGSSMNGVMPDFFTNNGLANPSLQYSNSTLGGTWSSNSSPVKIDITTGVITSTWSNVATNTSATITYTYSPSGSGCNLTTTKTVTIVGLPYVDLQFAASHNSCWLSNGIGLTQTGELNGRPSSTSSPGIWEVSPSFFTLNTMPNPCMAQPCTRTTNFTTTGNQANITANGIGTSNIAFYNSQIYIDNNTNKSITCFNYASLKIRATTTACGTKAITNTNKYELYNIGLYPNPVKSNSYISFNTNFKPFTVTINSMLGQTMLTKQMQPTQKLNIGNLTKGVYLVTIICDNETKTEKLIVE